MRTLLTTNLRPRIGYRSTRSTQFLPSATRRALGALKRGKFSFNDAFTLLLAPVLGTALIADTALKDRKQKDWNSKIAEVLEDIVSIQEREIQTWRNVQIRSIQRGVFQQRRSYTSQAQTSQSDYLTEDQTSSVERSERQRQGNDVDDLPELETILKDHSKLFNRQTSLQLSEAVPKSQPSPYTFESLIAWRLAIEMHLLLLGSHAEPALSGSTSSTASAPLMNAREKLMFESSVIGAQIRDLETCQMTQPLQYTIPMDRGQEALESKIYLLTDKYKEGKIQIRNLVRGYSNAVCQAKRPLSLRVYTTLLQAVASRRDAPELSDLVAKAVASSRQPLSIESFRAVIWQCGKFKQTHRLELYLLKLTEKLQSTASSDLWEAVDVGSQGMKLPTNRDVRLMGPLVTVALQLGLKSKAATWARIMCQEKDAVNVESILRSFLRHCGKTNNWELGHQWLQAAVMWISICSDAITEIIFQILDLCVICRQREAYDQILWAAIQSGITIDLSSLRTNAMSRTARGRSIRLDWLRKFRTHGDEFEIADHPPAFKARCFQELLATTQSRYAPFVGISDPSILEALTKEQYFVVMSKSNPSSLLTPKQVLNLEPAITALQPNRPEGDVSSKMARDTSVKKERIPPADTKSQKAAASHVPARSANALSHQSPPIKSIPPADTTSRKAPATHVPTQPSNAPSNKSLQTKSLPPRQAQKVAATTNNPPKKATPTTSTSAKATGTHHLSTSPQAQPLPVRQPHAHNTPVSSHSDQVRSTRVRQGNVPKVHRQHPPPSTTAFRPFTLVSKVSDQQGEMHLHAV